MYQESVKQLKRSFGTGVRGDRVGRQTGRVGKYGYADGAGSGFWRESRSTLQLIANQMLSIQENERKRIATDLHDGVGQSLTMIKLSLSLAVQQLASGAIEDASESLQQLKLKVHGALEEVRHAAMDLRPPMLDDLGLLATLTWFFRELDAAFPNMKVEKDFGVHENRIPDQLKITIFRILQEATSNIVKYAHADLMRVRLKQVDDTLHLSIEDNGCGFDPEEVFIRSGSDRGLGLLNMKERATLSGGIYVMDTVIGQGTQIRVAWQLDSSGAW